MQKSLSFALATFCFTALAVTLTFAPSTLHAQSNSVVTSGSGLKYMDLVVGTGASPKIGDHLTVKYEGKLVDGTVFDSSEHLPGGTYAYIHGVTHLIPGWTEGVSTMKEGGKRKLIIPPQLGYGMEGAAGIIPPNATLIFVIELVKVGS